MAAAEALHRSRHEPAAFAVFYEQHAEEILRFTTRRVYGPQVALDLTAETFSQAYLARAKFRGRSDGEAAAWLHTIARRQLARYFRRGEAERKALQRLAIHVPRIDEAEQERVRKFAELGDLRAVLREELKQIAATQRQALQLRVVDELPYPEVAKRLGISEQAARARVSRALRALATALENHPKTEEALR